MLLLWPALVLAGCTANQQSRQLASQLRQLTAEYNAASARKLQAEQDFYLQSGKNLDNTLNVVDPTKEAAEVDVKDTLAYGRIITTTNSESLKLAGDLINDAGGAGGSAGAAAKITAFLQDGVRSEDQAFREARAQQAQAAAAMATDLAAIEQYQTALTSLVRQLSQLENPQSFGANASEVEAIGKAVIDQIRKEQTPKK